MFARTIGLSATLALAANAVLIPPGIALSKEQEKEYENALSAFPQSASVPMRCFGCPFAESDGQSMAWSREPVENSLVYQFGFGRDHDRLTLGGVQLYPPSFNEPEPIYIHQVPSDVESVNAVTEYLADHPDRKALQITGMEFAFNAAETISEDGNELLTMHLKVLGLADMPLPPQVLRLHVIKDTEGRLNLASIIKLNDPEEIMAEEEEQCKSWPLLCQWRHLVADKFSSWRSGRPTKGCTKGQKHGGDRIDNRPHHGIRPWGMPPPPDGFPEGHPPLPEGHPHGRPHHGPHHGEHPHGERPHGWHHGHHGHHGHHPQHSKFQRFIHMVARIMADIVVPILIGITAGVVTYTAGMLIGMTAALIWFKIRGTRRGEYDSVPQDEEDRSDADFKVGKEAYRDEEEAEVIGEAPPVYEEVAEKETTN